MSWGTEIYAKIIAYNTKGHSRESKPGHGGLITTNPDEPINVGENFAIRTPDALGLIWDQGADNGGDVILDYRISFAEVDQVYSVL